MKKIFVIIMLLVGFAHAEESNPSQQCQAFLSNSQIVGFQMVSVNGNSTTDDEFKQISELMFSQLKKAKPKISRKEIVNLEADQRQLEAYSENNNVEKIYLNVKAPANEAYQPMYNDPTKSFLVTAFMNALAADSVTQLDLPESTLGTFSDKISTLQYVVVEFDGEKSEDNFFHRCNCYLIDSFQRFKPESRPNSDNFWACSSSLQPEANRKNVLSW